MLRKRGNPTFLELMKGPAPTRAPRPAQSSPPPPPPPAPLFESARATSAAPAPAVEPKPVAHVGTFAPQGSQTPPTAAAHPPAPATGFQPWSADQVQRRASALLGRSPWILVAAIVGTALVVWILAYSLGLSAGKADGDRRVADVSARYAPPSEPLDPGRAGDPPQRSDPPANPDQSRKSDNTPPGGGSGSSTPAPKPSPSPVKPGPTPAPEPPPALPSTVDTLTPGYNYLVVATLMKADADEAAAYLTANGVPVTLRTVSGKPIDPASPEANNVQWQVVVLKGYAPADLGRLSGERMALATKVQSLGRRWKAENKRAPTDFAQVYWWKFKG